MRPLIEFIVLINRGRSVDAIVRGIAIDYIPVKVEPFSSHLRMIDSIHIHPGPSTLAPRWFVAVFIRGTRASCICLLMEPPIFIVGTNYLRVAFT